MILSQGLTTIELLTKIMIVFGGLGLFLYGINSMGDSLKSLAGDKMKVFIEKTTNTPLKGILVGALVTALIQSSSGTTALAVSLVRSGLMTFPQAIGVIMGANIGTTITSFIIGLKVEKLSLLFVGLGALLIFFIKNVKIQELGKILFGFGLLFFGLQQMGDSLKTILDTYSEQTELIFASMSNYPILGLLVGTLITAVVQSSSATIGILQTLYAQGTIQITGSIAILLGCNIGTTVTATFACIGGGTQAKRTAFVHALFNIVGALLFMILLWPYSQLITLIENSLLSGLGEHPAMSIAVAHIIFNFVTTFILYFFIKLMVKLAELAIKESKEEHDTILDDLLDHKLIDNSPTLALSFAKKSVDYMFKLVNEFVNLAKSYSSKRDKNALTRCRELENTINTLDKRIHDYLIKLTIEDLSNANSKILSIYLDTIKDLERIGDHCTNLFEFYEERYETDKAFSLDGIQDLDQMFAAIVQMTDITNNSFNNWDKELAKTVDAIETKIDKMEEVFHNRHVHRINSGACSYDNTDHFVEILSNIERIGDHLTNISQSVLYEESVLETI